MTLSFPFDLSNFFSPWDNLENILERNFQLVYFMHMNLSDCYTTDSRKLEWLYSRLCKQWQDEKEAIEKGREAQKKTWQRH